MHPFYRPSSNSLISAARAFNLVPVCAGIFKANKRDVCALASFLKESSGTILSKNPAL
jgi:hypothetical protein